MEVPRESSQEYQSMVCLTLPLGSNPFLDFLLTWASSQGVGVCLGGATYFLVVFFGIVKLIAHLCQVW